MDNYIDLLKLILPTYLVEHFELTKSEQKGEHLHLYFEEKSKTPTEFSDRILVSKGFYNEITVQDFPLRGKFVYLHVKRRRWTDKTTGEIVFREWKEIEEGTRMTNEFSAFLKEIGRY